MCAGDETISASEQRRADARRYLEQERAFRIHAIVAACSLVVIVAVNALVNVSAGIAGEWWAWWSLWAVLGWGIGIAAHGIAVRTARTNSPRPPPPTMTGSTPSSPPSTTPRMREQTAE